jgi:hypothetical protein
MHFHFAETLDEALGITLVNGLPLGLEKRRTKAPATQRARA